MRFGRACGADDGVGAKGALGPPVNCWTMARKFVVSVLSKVVGVRREARERRRVGLVTRPSGLKWVKPDELEFGMSDEGLVAVTIVAVVVVVLVTVKSGIDGVRFWL
ncbi:hypothetical protein E2542_SST29966 [Spatholobus suberectus]|nr:hypothetical protein E2542_SST29966 [Spatholobus suberectus]